MSKETKIYLKRIFFGNFWKKIILFDNTLLLGFRRRFFWLQQCHFIEKFIFKKVYNLAGGHGVIIGNSVAIPEPWLESVDFKFDLNKNLKNKNVIQEIKVGFDEKNTNEFEFKFNSIRVENPTVLVVNGKKWTKEKISSAFFVPKVISD